LARFNFNLLHRFQSGILNRVQEVQERASKRSKALTDSIPLRRQRQIKGFGLLVAAGVLGIWANEITQKDTLLRWEKTHLPPKEIMSYALGSRGLQEINDVKTLQQASRYLPSNLDEAGMIWISPHSNWVTYYFAKDEMIQTTLYCLECSEIPRKWTPVGLGWKGLELALKIVDQAKGELKKASPPKKDRRPYRDPKELLY
jgi:hypothetical protein